MEEKHHEIKVEQKKRSNTGTYVMIGLVCLLLIFAVAQSFQIGAVQDKMIAGGGFATAGVSGRAGAGASPQAARVPAMVGGC